MGQMGPYAQPSSAHQYTNLPPGTVPMVPSAQSQVLSSHMAYTDQSQAGSLFAQPTPDYPRTAQHPAPPPGSKVNFLLALLISFELCYK